MRTAVIGLVAAWAMLIFVQLYSSYQARQDIVESQRAGCERGKLDRTANAQGWRNAEAARRASGDDEIADVYRGIAEGLEARSRVVCSVAFPTPPFIKLGD
jgi:hypothetical protein